MTTEKKSRSSDMQRQRQRDSAALDAFTQVIRNQMIETSDGKLIAIPYKQTWREMMIWIRENFTPTRPA